MTKLARKGGVWAEFIAFFEKHNGCVLKPLKGTGGFGVERVGTAFYSTREVA